VKSGSGAVGVHGRQYSRFRSAEFSADQFRAGLADAMGRERETSSALPERAGGTVPTRAAHIQGGKSTISTTKRMA
jgi:hypothetical protein